MRAVRSNQLPRSTWQSRFKEGVNVISGAVRGMDSAEDRILNREVGPTMDGDSHVM